MPLMNDLLGRNFPLVEVRIGLYNVYRVKRKRKLVILEGKEAIL